MGFWRSTAGRRRRRARERDEDDAAPRGGGLLRRPRAVLVVSLAAIAALGAVGLGVEDQLSPTSLEIPGTESSRANQLLDENFGESAPFVILLRGPERALERQGPRLIRTLREDPRVTTLSPWDRGSVRRLRPSPREAIVIADFHVGIDEAVNETVPRLDRTLEREVRPPVRAIQTGYATLSRAIQDDSIEATERGELIALPVLLIVLLLVFRSPIAAFVPLAFGAATVVASRGLLSFAAERFSVDAFALTVCTMMGLALGVDYALLMVSRFREELAAGTEPGAAARATRRTAGRTTAFAGSTLMLSMLVAFFVVPGSLLGSLAATLLLVVALSVLFAIVPLPALLVLLGPRIDRWRIGPAPGAGRSRLMVLVGAALRRPAAVSVAIGLLLLALAAPAVGLKTGPPSQTQLPAEDPVREDFERIERAIGPGYDAPFVVVAAAPEGPITTERRLDALTRWQRRVAELPGVQAVVGPAQVNEAVRPVRNADRLVASALGGIDFGGLDQLRRLGLELGRAAGGVAELREGVAAASYGAGLLAAGSGNAGRGARMLAAGLSRAGSGSERAVAALDTFAKGTRRLAGAQQRAAIAGLQLKFGLQSVGPNLQVNGLRRARGLKKLLEEEVEDVLPKLEEPAGAAEDSLGEALEDLEGMTVGAEDPEYEDALDAVREALAAVGGTDPETDEPYAPEYEGLPDELAALRERLEADAGLTNQVISWIESSILTLNQLSNGADQLSDGLLELEEAGERLAAGAARLARAATGLEEGVQRLEAGAEALAGGLDRLTGGADALEENLAAGYREALPLQTGLSEASVQVISTDESVQRRVDRVQRRVGRVRRQAGRLQRVTPGLFDSGYFVLSALDGARPAIRERAATAVDIDGGGQAAQMLVISRYTFNSPGSRLLNERLDRRAKALSGATGLETGVAGGAAQLNDYSTVTADRIPWVVAAITLATFLILIVVLRAIPLAAIAVALNLATVAVAFGVLTLLFDLPEDWPLGGRTYVDAVGATAIFGVVFGLSIDYAVFLVMRMREHYDRHGDNAAAVEFGLARTARVITGAAAIMMAVFVAFAGAPIATVSQLGVGLTVAVLLDATVVRIVLLPALMLLLGDRVWWLPGPLRRALPRLDV